MKVLHYNKRVTLTIGICVVNGISYSNPSNATEHVLSIKETSVKITGVKLPESTESAKITGVYTDQEPMLPEPNGFFPICFLQNDA